MGLENLGNGSYRKTFTKAELKGFGVKGSVITPAEFERIQHDLIYSLRDEIVSTYDKTFNPEGALSLEVEHELNGDLTITMKSITYEEFERFRDEFPEDSYMEDDGVFGEETSGVDPGLHTYRSYDGTYELAYEFSEIEDAMAASDSRLFEDVWSSELYHYDGKYVLLLNFGELYYDEDQLGYEADADVLYGYLLDCGASLAEYGNPSGVTSLVLREYGKVILESNALARLPKLYDVE